MLRDRVQTYGLTTIVDEIVHYCEELGNYRVLEHLMRENIRIGAPVTTPELRSFLREVVRPFIDIEFYEETLGSFSQYGENMNRDEVIEKLENEGGFCSGLDAVFRAYNHFTGYYNE